MMTPLLTILSTIYALRLPRKWNRHLRHYVARETKSMNFADSAEENASAELPKAFLGAVLVVDVDVDVGVDVGVVDMIRRLIQTL